MATKKPVKTEVVYVRMTPELAKRIDRRADALRRKLPTGTWTRADVARLALERYLAPKPRT